MYQSTSRIWSTYSYPSPIRQKKEGLEFVSSTCLRMVCRSLTSTVHLLDRSFFLLDVLGTLVKLSEPDRPFGIQAEVLRSVQNMVVLLDEQFLVHSAVHKAVLRLLHNCVGEDVQEHLDGRNRVMGAAGDSTRGSPSEYEEDRECHAIDLLVITQLCISSRQSAVHLVQPHQGLPRTSHNFFS